MSCLTHCMLIFTWLYISAFRNVSFLPLCHWIIRTLPLRTFICTLKCFHAPLLVSFQQSHGVEVTREEIVHFSNFLDFALHLCFSDLAKKIRATDRGHLVSLDKDIGRKQKKHKNKFDIHKSLICRRVRGGHAAGSCSCCIRLRKKSSWPAHVESEPLPSGHSNEALDTQTALLVSYWHTAVFSGPREMLC